MIETQSVGQNLEVEVLFPVIETSTAVRQEQNVHLQKGAKPTEKKTVTGKCELLLIEE